MKKIFALLLALAMLFSLAACGGSNSGNAPANEPAAAEPAAPAAPAPAPAPAGVTGISEDAVLNVALPAEPDFLLPTYGNPTVADSILQLTMFDSLVTIDSNGEIQPCLAESWEWVDDTHIRFHIRKGVTCYDGSEFKASDVYYVFKCGLGVNFGEMYFINYINLEETKVEDDYTILVGIPEPDPTFLSILCDTPFRMFDESSVEANGGFEASALNPLCGTGRYFLSEWKAGQYVDIVRNDNYWGGTDDCYYKTIRFTWVSDNASRALNVKSGDVDVAVDLSYPDVSSMMNDDSVRIDALATPRSCTITFNCADGLLFNNEKLREAVYYATNVDDAAFLLYNEFADPITSAVPTSVSYYLDQLSKVEYSPEKAKAALAEAGYPDGFEFSLIVEPGAGYGDVAELIQSQLLEVGIKMNVEKVELIDYFGRVAPGNYDAYIGTLSFFDVKTYLNQCDGRLDYFASLGGTAYFSDEMNALIDQAKSTDEAVALEGLHKVQEMAFDQHLYVGVSSFINVTAVSSKVTGAEYTGFGRLLAYTLRPAA